ncbi:hypothetical protein MNV49_000604 [Pseudohyphozyma bogoriensis]|nr:hypothetical protein MNV49_000604 [Pseudohyphozyma bogoriensis]
MSAFDRFALGGTLHDFLRSLASPRYQYTTTASSSPSSASASAAYSYAALHGSFSQSDTLEFLDSSLVGEDGANAVLRALAQRPGSRAIALSQNNLGDAGVRALVTGMKRLRSRGVGYRSALTQLHFSVCGLTPATVRPLVGWLESPASSGLSVLGANGNFLSAAGVRRIERAVVSGRCSSLLHLECFANDDVDDLPEKELSIVGELEEEERKWAESEEVETGAAWRQRLTTALERNRRVLKETRHAALALLPKARIIFGGSPVERPVDVEGIRRGVEALSDGSQPGWSDATSSATFPFLRLPIELQVHVLRMSLLLKPSSDAHLYPPSSSPSSSLPPPNHNVSATTSIQSSPLTESQFLRLLSYASTRTTLLRESQIVEGRVPTINNDAYKGLFAQVLAAVPPGTDPFPAVGNALEAVLLYHRDALFDRQIIGISVTYGVYAVLLCVALAQGCRLQKFSLFRLEHTLRGTYLKPHLTTSWLIWALVFVIVIQGYVWTCYRQGHGKEVPEIIWLSSIGYFPLGLAAWSALWSVSVSKALLISHPKGFVAFLSHPTVLASFFVVLPVIFLGLIIAMDALSYHYNVQSLDRLHIALEQLAEARSAWSGADSDVLPLLDEKVLAPAAGLIESSFDFLYWYKKVWLVCFSTPLAPAQAAVLEFTSDDRHGLAYTGICAWLCFTDMLIVPDDLQLVELMGLFAFAVAGPFIGAFLVFEDTLLAGLKTLTPTQGLSGSTSRDKPDSGRRLAPSPLGVRVDVTHESQLSSTHAIGPVAVELEVQSKGSKVDLEKGETSGWSE